MIGVLIADDHGIVREGIKRLLAETREIRVTGEAADGNELLKAVVAGEWNVVVMDLAMPGPPGLEVLADIRRLRPSLPVLVLSMYPEDHYAVRAFAEGAAGYLSKGRPSGELVTAIRTVVTGQRYITPEVAASLASHVDNVSSKPPHTRLSNREYQVLCLIASGKSISDIARELSLSVKTVSTFRSRILQKLDLRHNAELTRYALQHGLIE